MNIVVNYVSMDALMYMTTAMAIATITVMVLGKRTWSPVAIMINKNGDHHLELRIYLHSWPYLSFLAHMWVEDVDKMLDDRFR